MRILRKGRVAGFAPAVTALVIPIALQSLISAAVNAADVVMLSSVGQQALAAVSVAGQVTFTLQLFYMGMAGGLTVLASQYYGKGDEGAVERALGIAAGLSSLVSLVFFLGALLTPAPLLRVFTSDPALVELGTGYLRALAPSYMMTGLSQMYLCVLKSVKRPGLSAAVSASCLLINIALNALSIFVLFPGDPARAVVAVAVSTSAARLAELVWCLWHSARRGRVRLRLGAMLRPDRALFGDYARCTAPMQANYLIWGCALAATAAIMGHVSTDMVAANAVASTVRNLAIVLCNGVAGASILVGQYLGEGKLAEARRAGRYLCLCSLVFGALAGISILLARPWVVSVARLNKTAGGYLGGMLYVCALYCIGKSFNSTVVGGIFCAGADTRFGLVLDAVVMWGVILPLGGLCAFMLRLPPVALYAVFCLDEFIKLPAVIVHFRRYRWLKNITREESV